MFACAVCFHYIFFIAPHRHSSPRHSPKDRRVSRSGSVPNLTTCHHSSIGHQSSMSPTHRTHTHHRSSIAKGKSPRHRASSSGRAHLHALLANRHGASFDETGPYLQHYKSSTDGPNEHCSKRDRNKRSDTAKRHVLARQKQVDNFEQQTKFNKSRRYFQFSAFFLVQLTLSRICVLFQQFNEFRHIEYISQTNKAIIDGITDTQH